ncbi:MAG: glycosyltransferase family 39 protein, partial [Nitrospinota bacterium]|nr:glycosyltransferase family 39 protein [Nitrospinota bacterium]
MTLTDPSRNDRWLTRIPVRFLAGGFLGGWVLAAGLESFRWGGITRLPGWEIRWAAALLAVWTLLSPGTVSSIFTALRDRLCLNRAAPPAIILPRWGLVVLGASVGALWWELPGTLFLTAAFLVGFRSVLRRLPPGERTSLSRLISLALAIRLLFIFVYYPLASFMGWTAAWLTLDVPLVHVTVLFGDGVDAISLSRAWALYWRGDWVSPAEFAEIVNPDRSLFSIHGDVRHLLPPALLFFVFGVEMIGARVLSAVATVCAAVIAYLTLRDRFGARAAWCGAALLAFWPTLFFWSLDALKEPYFLLLLIASAYFAERFSREGGWRPMAASVVMLGLALSVRTRWFPPIVFTAVICLGGWVIRKALHRFSRVRQA